MMKPPTLDSQTFDPTMGKSHYSEPELAAETEEESSQPSTSPTLSSYPKFTCSTDPPILRLPDLNDEPAFHRDRTILPEASQNISREILAADGEWAVSGDHAIVQNISQQDNMTPGLASPTESRWSDSEDDDSQERMYLLSKPRKGLSSSKLRVKRSFAAIRNVFRRSDPSERRNDQ
ncbi:hypothetical protein SISSUDRAFT_709744 [Sistotremastrum suecicum HHB10207 ss-3]|uniref:Uncharacterized protein n=1 Tax=Sistotremastrum suecicum HHB10207 ss-3 TaxID=1314776 RepID=A0A166DQW6_9AGAM|nr:hypothetical protein SISSUDRAFT_709744 [Sistotremastrum suecicum HHB10207 ss-3]